MKKLFYILIISFFLSGCSKSVKTISVDTINANYNKVEIGMSLNEVQSKLGKENIIFTDDDKDYYVWTTYKKGDNEITITVQNGKVINKEINSK